MCQCMAFPYLVSIGWSSLRQALLVMEMSESVQNDNSAAMYRAEASRDGLHKEQVCRDLAEFMQT